jgi:hypothetical protein
LFKLVVLHQPETVKQLMNSMAMHGAMKEILPSRYSILSDQ